MAKFNDFSSMVYSTNPDFVPQDNSKTEFDTLTPNKQKLYVSLDKKQRRGKKVTIVEGFIGKEADLKDLAKMLKSKCGVGGSAKENQIIIQGDFREKIADILKQAGYQCKTI